MIFFRLAAKSLLNRKGVALLSILSVALSVGLLLGVEKVRTGAKEGFLNTISGTDLIVGARASGVQLLLYSVFHIGNATNNVTMETINHVANRREVKWLVPISLGDSYRGFRVVGTTGTYFERFRYSGDRPLEMAQGKWFEDLYDVVLGSQVAKDLNHALGDVVIISHGAGEVSFSRHDEDPFTVTGILAPTGTPVDKSVFVSLKAIEAIHVNWQPGVGTTGPRPDEAELTPTAVTAAMVGLNSKIQTFSLQRYINEYPREPVTAILPGVAFAELWSVVSNAELALIVISAMVVITAIIGMMITILSTLNERRREMAILRSVGARPAHIFLLFCAEALFIAAVGAAIGVALVYGIMLAAAPLIRSVVGLNIPITAISTQEAVYLGCIVAGGLAAGLIPAYRALKMSLADGLVIRL